MPDEPSSERLNYRVEMVLPPPAREARDRLDETLHRSDRHIGVITAGHERGLRLAILFLSDDANAARAKAMALVTAALDRVGLGELVPDVEVGEVIGRPLLPGGAHPVDIAPTLSYSATKLPDGRLLSAAFEDETEEWFAYTDDDPECVMSGRVLGQVLHELLALPWGKKEEWFYEAIGALAGQMTSDGIRYPCPCCSHLTLDEAPGGSHAICGVCCWEDDGVQLRDPDYRGGANGMSLNEARKNFRQFGASEKRRLPRVRLPRREEHP